VDDPDRLKHVVGLLGEVSDRLPAIWPIHPRTAANPGRFALDVPVCRHPINVIPAQGYLSMVALMRAARMVLTDSGGVQEETTALSVPCITLRANTERPITVEQGTNTLVGTDRRRLLDAVEGQMRRAVVG